MAAEIRKVSSANAFSKQNIRASPEGLWGYVLLIWGPGKHGWFRMFLPGQGHWTQVGTKSAEHILGTATAARGAAHAHFWRYSFAGTGRPYTSPSTPDPSVNNRVPTREMAGPGLQVLLDTPGTWHIICLFSFPCAQNGKPPGQQHLRSS